MFEVFFFLYSPEITVIWPKYFYLSIGILYEVQNDMVGAYLKEDLNGSIAVLCSKVVLLRHNGTIEKEIQTTK